MHVNEVKNISFMKAVNWLNLSKVVLRKGQLVKDCPVK
jgi:hypothetical protein